MGKKLEILNRCEEMGYTLLGDFVYKNNRSEIKLGCNKCGHVWDVSFYNFINLKSMCSKCRGVLKLTQHEAEININNRCEEMGYELLESFVYINSDLTRIKLRCCKDGYVWESSYRNFMRSGCLKCSGKLKLTQEQSYKNILDVCKDKYDVIEEYIHINNESRIKLKCKEDGYIWEISYYNLVNSNKGCPKCKGNLKLTQGEAELNVSNKCKETGYGLLKKFKYITNSKTRLKIKCHKDQNEWDVSYYNFIHRNSGCPVCNESQGEKKINNYLIGNNLSFVKEKIFKECKNLGYLKFDFYLTDLNILIEYDGIQHFKPVKNWGGEKTLLETIKKDKIKNDYCSNNNIKLIRITYKDFKNIENILNQKLK